MSEKILRGKTKMSRKGIILLIMALAVALSACSKNQPASNANASRPQEILQLNPDVKDVEGFTPLMNAIKNGNTDGAQTAIKNGGNVNAATPSGITALFIAAGMGQKDMVKLLIEKGANVNQKADGGFTPLMQAAMVGQKEVVQMLLDAGADPGVKDTGNKTAADWAQEKEHKELAAMLKPKGGQPATGKK
jgi:ankyrin repeat protein